MQTRLVAVPRAYPNGSLMGLNPNTELANMCGRDNASPEVLSDLFGFDLVYHEFHPEQ